MHLPYVRKVFEGYVGSLEACIYNLNNFISSMDIKIVPIVVGALKYETETEFGALLAPYLARSDTFCVVSSDFCHW